MKVSILIPFYNASPNLRATIESALSQTYGDKEIILIDDGSTDDSLTIAQSFVSRGVKLFSQENSGACHARNKAFAESSGDFIQYLDGDDLLSPGKIANQMSMISTGSDRDIVSSCRFMRFTNEKEIPSGSNKMSFLDRDWENPLDWLLSEWSGKGMGQTSIWLTPRHLIRAAGPWDERLGVNQDGEFFCRVLLKSSGIRFCKNSFVFYRSGNNESVSQNFNKRKAEHLLLSYKSYEQNALSKEDSIRVRQALARKYASYIYSYFDRFPELSGEARCYIHALGFKRLPIMGGRNFKLLAKLSGFQNALRIRSITRKLFDQRHASA